MKQRTLCLSADLPKPIEWAPPVKKAVARQSSAPSGSPRHPLAAPRKDTVNRYLWERAVKLNDKKTLPAVSHQRKVFDPTTQDICPFSCPRIVGNQVLPQFDEDVF